MYMGDLVEYGNTYTCLPTQPRNKRKTILLVVTASKGNPLPAFPLFKEEVGRGLVLTFLRIDLKLTILPLRLFGGVRTMDITSHTHHISQQYNNELDDIRQASLKWVVWRSVK